MDSFPAHFAPSHRNSKVNKLIHPGQLEAVVGDLTLMCLFSGMDYVLGTCMLVVVKLNWMVDLGMDLSRLLKKIAQQQWR